MAKVRIIGDVHGLIQPEDLLHGKPHAYTDLIAGADFSIQVGDMGDEESYRQLDLHVDADRHRFFCGNHEQFGHLPRHCLGDFGAISWGGVDLFYIRGASSLDKQKLVQLGRQLGKTLWHEQEELTTQQMDAAEQEFLRAKPTIMLSHNAPTHIARFAWNHARRFSHPNLEAVFRESRTNAFLSRLLDQHAPRCWIFGHHHRNWKYTEAATTFACVGELSFLDVNQDGILQD